MLAPSNEILLGQLWIFVWMESNVNFLLLSKPHALKLSSLPISSWLSTMFYNIFITGIISTKDIWASNRRIRCLFGWFLHTDDSQLSRAHREKFQKCGSLMNLFANACTLLLKMSVPQLQFTIERKFTNAWFTITRSLLYSCGVYCISLRFCSPVSWGLTFVSWDPILPCCHMLFLSLFVLDSESCPSLEWTHPIGEHVVQHERAGKTMTL